MSYFPGITLAIPLSETNEEWVQRLDVCLNSIKHQTISSDLMDVVISYTPTLPFSGDGDLLSLAAEYGVAIVCQPHDCEEWTPAFTRNVGGRWSRRACLTFIDIDAVLHPEYLEEALTLMCAYNLSRAVAVKTKMTRYPAGSPEYLRVGSPEEFEDMIECASGNIAPGTGCGTIVGSLIFEYLGGLDERFIGYGPTDWDFTERLKGAGVPIVDLTQITGIMLAHQHHPRPVQDGSRENVPSRSRNKEMMDFSLRNLEWRRNSDGWGGLPWRERLSS